MATPKFLDAAAFPPSSMADSPSPSPSTFGRRWFCPSCTCGLCGLRNSNSDRLFTEFCYQCSRQYHVDCLNKAGIPFSDDHLSDKFCSRRCFEICARLHDLLQTSNPTSMEGLTWTITRSRRNDCNIHDERVHPIIQSSQVLNVFHECFQPIIEPHTKRDLVADVVYNSGSKFRRLDFHGFYVMVLLNGEELACVATVRIHGHKVAEMPLVATPFKYRRQAPKFLDAATFPPSSMADSPSPSTFGVVPRL
ncbi:hypothetical protein Ancab_024340 [Ancistrocladus abbreviatus]